MSFAPATKVGRVPLRVWAVYFGVLGLLLLFFAQIAQLAKNRLSQKFTGPHYFKVCEKNGQMPQHCISVADARAQMGRIIQERKLAPVAAAQINQLIEKLTVPASARVIGVDHVSALQLNLALEKLPISPTIGYDQEGKNQILENAREETVTSPPKP